MTSRPPKSGLPKGRQKALGEMWAGEPNVNNRTLFIGDNLPMLEGINTGTIDLVYLDPPFNSNKNYEAPIGSRAAGAQFKDAWTFDMIDEAWIGQIADHNPKLMQMINAIGAADGKGDKSYLVFMARRLLELHRVLKESGSIYLHCDPVMSHSIKLLMDCVFGKKNFRNEIVWHYSNASRGKNRFAQSHDLLLYYGMSDNVIFNRDDILAPFASGMTEWRYTKGGQRGKKMPEGKTPDDVISLPALNAMSKERTGYPTQKPLALLERIIKASSNKGDMVLDPFCGCATACVAAEHLGRQWIGIDISPVARRLLKDRLAKELDYKDRDDDSKSVWNSVEVRKEPTMRTDSTMLNVNPIADKHTLYGEQEGICKGCRVFFPFRNMTIDHIIPQALGGQDIITNLQLLCGACNSKKGVRRMEELLVDLKTRAS